MTIGSIPIQGEVSLGSYCITAADREFMRKNVRSDALDKKRGGLGQAITGNVHYKNVNDKWRKSASFMFKAWCASIGRSYQKNTFDACVRVFLFNEDEVNQHMLRFVQACISGGIVFSDSDKVRVMFVSFLSNVNEILIFRLFLCYLKSVNCLLSRIIMIRRTHF